MSAEIWYSANGKKKFLNDKLEKYFYMYDKYKNIFVFKKYEK